MASGQMKCTENVYYQARKEAALYNDKLNSREGAAELLGISVSSLADYELGMTKFVPVDKVRLMAELYNAPQLMNGYCKYECPLGEHRILPVKVESVELATLKFLDALNKIDLRDVQMRLTTISSNGRIDEDEKDDFLDIVSKLEAVQEQIETLKLLADKIGGVANA
ncbi:MAG: helix-turn-helix transcriptional regulator [Ruminococcus sp.]|nr:helix-turn-helix transcriptional regulator [Ruminococcus sp.]